MARAAKSKSKSKPKPKSKSKSKPKPKPTPKAAAKAKPANTKRAGAIFPQCDPAVRDALAAKHWPKGIGKTAVDTARIARGWPQLRELVDGDKRDKKPAELADKVFRAIDPQIPIAWPREAAKHFVCKFAGVEPGELTADTVDRALDAAVGALGYKFKIIDTLLLAECFLGADVVAERVVSRLERFTKAEWNSDNPNDNSIVIISMLEPLLLRASRAGELCARLRALAPTSKKGLPAIRLGWLVTSHLPADIENEPFLYDVPIQTVDVATLPTYLAHQYGDWLLNPQHLYVAGPAIVDEQRHVAKLQRGPTWRKKWVKEVFGIIAHPVADRIAGTVDAGIAEADSLEKLTPKQRAKQETAAVAKLFETFVAELEKVRGKPKLEKPLWMKVVADLIELRANHGNPTPEFHIGHILAVDGWDAQIPAPLETLGATDEENERWMDMLDAAIDAA